MRQEIPVAVGKLYEMTIERLGSNAEGVAHVRGFTVFVPGALPEEVVRVRIRLVKKSYAVGEIVERVTDSPVRVTPKCPIYEACGGCQTQHMTYKAQLAWKRQLVSDALHHIGGLQDVKVLPVKGAENPWHYRNKVQFPVGRAKGEIAIGCYTAKTHAIVNTGACDIQDMGNNEIIRAMREAVERFRIPVYDEDRHTGVLRHVMGRVGKNGELMAVLVTAVPELHRARDIVAFLRKRLKNLVSVQQNIQTYRNNVILGRETKLLWGRPTITDTIGNMAFRISPRSFFQVNTAQANVLYQEALDRAALTGRETVMDLYCGTGTITLFLAQKARKVYGIEIVQPAVRDAQKNARDNHVKNAEFIVGDATAVLPRLYQQGIRADVVVVDPPRAGCTPVVLETIAAISPSRVVYVSCNPASLARDMALFKDLGYTAKEVQPVDMFPMTSHVESVTSLERNKT